MCIIQGLNKSLKSQGDNWYVNSPSNEQTKYKYELEKAHLEIELLKQQISDLREINELLKKSEKQK